MPIENVTAAAQQYGAECADAARAAAAATYEPLLAAKDAIIEDLRRQIVDRDPDPNQPPPGYTVLNPGDDLRTALARGPVALPNGGGEWRMPGQFQPEDTLDLWLGEGSRALATWSTGSNATRGSVFANRDYTRRLSRVRITGKGTLAVADGCRANVLGLLTDDGLIDGVTIENFQGRAFMSAGNWIIRDVLLRGDMAADSGGGSLRWAAGGTILVERVDSESSDDGLQVVPAGAPADPLLNAGDCISAVFRDSKVRSATGRPCIVAAQDANNDGSTSIGMNVGLYNILFERITGFGGASATVVKNVSSPKPVRGVTYRDVTIDQRDRVKGQPGEAYVEAKNKSATQAVKTGGVHDVDFSGLTILNPKVDYYRPVSTNGAPITGIVKPPQAA